MSAEKEPRIKAVLTTGTIVAHAAVVGAIGAMLIWLGQHVFVTRVEYTLMTEQIRQQTEAIRALDAKIEKLDAKIR